jgi:hypothetical protein
VRFALDSPFLLHGDDGQQLLESVRYGPEGVLLPLELLDLLAERWNGGRAVDWDPEEGRLLWGENDLASFRQVRVTQVGHRTTLRIPGRTPPRSRLLWSPVAGLDLSLEGWTTAPESLTIGPPRGTLAVEKVTPLPRGSRIRVAVSVAAVGASTRYDEREHAFELTTTTLEDEIDRGGFRPLARAIRPRSSLSGPVVIAAWSDPVAEPLETSRALLDLAHLVAGRLSTDFGLATSVIDGGDPLLAASRANALGARCFVGLRLDAYPGVGGVQVWWAAPRLRWAALDANAATSQERPLLWGEAPALSNGASRDLAATILEHLGALLGGETAKGPAGGLQMGERPSRYLEGLAMPAVLVYPASSNDPASLERLLPADRRDALARSLAFGMAEALRFEVPAGNIEPPGAPAPGEPAGQGMRGLP